MKESDIQSLLNKPLSKIERTFFYELKLSKNKAQTVPWSQFEDQQLPSLYKIKHSTYAWKISDMDIRRVFGDGFVAHKQDAFVAICFYKPRQQKTVYFICIDDIFEIKKLKRSIHIDDAIRLAKFKIDV